MTTVGENRKRYSETIERGPSRFDDPAAYSAWAARADAWAAQLPPERGTRRIAVARQVVESKTAGMLEGALLDLFTASALVQVYDALSPQNQARFDDLPLDKLVGLAFR